MVGTDKLFPKRTGYPRDPSETDPGGGKRLIEYIFGDRQVWRSPNSFFQ